MLCENLNSQSQYSEDKKFIKFSASIKAIVEQNMQDTLVSLFMNSYWLAKNNIDFNFHIYLKEHVRLAKISKKSKELKELNFNIDHEKYNEYLSDKIEKYPKIDKKYLEIQNLKQGIKDIDEKNQIKKYKKIFKRFTELLSEIYSKCGKEFYLKIQIKIQKEEIENGILDEIQKIKEYICLRFWLKEEEFLKYLNCEKITIPKKMKYLSNGKKIPFIIILNSNLELKSKFFYIFPSWRKTSKIDTFEFKNQHKDLLMLYDSILGFPPSVLLQDEILDFMLSQEEKLKSKMANGIWKLLIYSIFQMIADKSEEEEKMKFRFNYGFKREVIDLRSKEGKSFLKLPENQDLKEMFYSLKDFNKEYVKSAEISSLKKGWKIAFNEVLGFNFYNFADADKIQEIIELYKKTLEKAFSDELEKLIDLITTIEKSTLDIIDQIAKTINSISSEVHNSTIAVFGSLLVEILVVLSGKEEKLVWQLGILLIFQFIVFYIPMVNRKINGLVYSLLDTREVYEKSIDNSFKIMDLPNSDIFSKVRDFRENVNDQWSRFEESVVKEIMFSRWLSVGLFFLLLLLISAKPDASNNMIDFLVKNDVSLNNLYGIVSENLGDFLLVLTPILVLIIIVLFRFIWARKIKKSLFRRISDYSFDTGEKLPEECSIYNSNYLLIGFFILYFIFLLKDIFKFF